MDVVSTRKRSAIMACVGSKDTKPEIAVRRELHSLGFRFRLHRNDLPGKPDIVLPRFRAVVFVHGCFWHGHRCARGKCPTSNTNFWNEKLDRNIRRDRSTRRLLRNSGWRVFTVWECHTTRRETLRKRLAQIAKQLQDAQLNET